MEVLVLGSGAREHALAWRAIEDGHRPFALPGNPGLDAICEPVEADLREPSTILAAARRHSFDLVVVGPEDPLIAGLADALRQGCVAVVGPSAAAAQLEGSKAFAKALMAEAGIPTARHRTFVHASPALEYARQRYGAGFSLAVKASGAALGKGVRVCDGLDEAEEAIVAMLDGRVLGDAGTTVVLEDRLVGREFSLLTLCSAEGFWSLPAAQDYKRLRDGAAGPNTGGMGSVCPAMWVGDDLVGRTEERVVAPILQAMRERGSPYTGVLFSGIMVVGGEPYCLEYNVRFGDPETQSLVRALGTGLYDALDAVARGTAVPPVARARSAAAVVLASPGYPDAPEKGATIQVGALPEGVELFWAGARRESSRLTTSGGRVVTVSAAAASPSEAVALAYKGVAAVSFPGMQFRTDIGSA